MTDFRESVSNALDQLSQEDFALVLADLMGMEKLKLAAADLICPHCQGEVKARVRVLTPDYTGYTRALAALDGIGKGKPKDPDGQKFDDSHIEAAVERAVERILRRHIEEGTLTDEQLARLAAG